jgi:hypothetical protein
MKYFLIDNQILLQVIASKADLVLANLTVLEIRSIEINRKRSLKPHEDFKGSRLRWGYVCGSSSIFLQKLYISFTE